MRRVLVYGCSRNEFWATYLPERLRKTPGLVVRKQEGFFRLGDKEFRHCLTRENMIGRDAHEAHLWPPVPQEIIEEAQMRTIAQNGVVKCCSRGFDPHA